ncbi:P-loop containing nucleoside triphosphate hydrolase protein [Dichomitus squalens LYAD-421 SS1]|uniref:P-loop containing nucleoside triphosphate hydrolase protein n=1 Tax=Dichomitus squalens (strain LYAD-421) TaxID=732165 RepID=UPI0004415A52|nr:P-loop containing nucleoside triphosphate hydrolase protein [Dichomitus squalens LYAD-421 SS1]EJF64914.1 P-loop containing nucleoside triphosphate hydrolase protein [Dichomitus squalens LYAD-421 SS1]
MDLDDFDAAIAQLPLKEEPTLSTQSAKAAVNYLDSQWYSLVNRRGRWMDLIGDYAGSEPFIVDGEALIAMVLEDPLLALGRTHDISFQCLHVVYTLECMIKQISMRSDSFDIVFWHERRFLTLLYGENDYVTSSRSLARTILFNHLASMKLLVHTFTDLLDPAWLAYQRLRKPMFVMTSDGGTVMDSSPIAAAERILLQRVFLYSLLTQGVSVAMLRGAEYRDSKIMSFVYEQGLDSNPKSRFKKTFWLAVEIATSSLTAHENCARSEVPIHPLERRIESEASDNPALLLLRGVSRSRNLQRKHFPALLQVFVAHMLFLPHLDLRERAIPDIILPSELVGLLTRDFLPTVFLALEKIASVSDLDGRIFASLLDSILRDHTTPLQTLIGCDLSSVLVKLWVAHQLPSPDYDALRRQFPASIVVQDDSETESPPLSLLPFHHRLFDEELAAVNVEAEALSDDDEDDEESAAHLEFNTVFSDTQHWHNHKRAILPPYLGGGNSMAPLNEWQKKRQLRSEQRFMSKLQWHAETLTGALGTPLQQMVIPSVAKRKSRPTNSSRIEESKPTTPTRSGSGKKGKETLSSADKIHLAYWAQKQAKEDGSNVAWWQEQLAVIENSSSSAASSSSKITALEHLMRNKRTYHGWLSVESRLYRIHLEFCRWLEVPDHESASVRDRFTVSIMCMVKDLYESEDLFPTAAAKLAACLICLGLNDYIQAFESAATVSAEDRKLHFSFVKLVKSKGVWHPVHKWMRITEDPVVWQLRLFGDFMDRSMDSARDPRVSFKADAWQRKVLDCLDQNESVLVVAPTSAGKTFISFYAMEKLLRSSNDDIVVYVAPTKALVSQIAAEVFARFRKDLGGRAFWAIHTRDYRMHNPQNCQILVTVPEILATMLLSPPLARSWTPRIKRIILDEIHTIGQQEGGAVWEQIILLAPCPLLGLSATIGEPEKFNVWLASVQEAHGFKHTFIQHPHRYSHLRKFTYLIEPKEKPAEFQGLQEYRKSDRLRFIHPISMLSFGARHLPPDFSLEAGDCLSLYHALESVRDRLHFNVGSLDPTPFFADLKGVLLKQRDILRYEAVLTGHVSELIESTDPLDQDSVLNQVIRHVSDPVIVKVNQRFIPDADAFFRNLIGLVSDLHINGDLPALLFHFDRKVCEKMAETILEVLAGAEAKWRETSPEWRRKITQWKFWVSKSKERERQAERLKKVKKEKDEANATPETQPEQGWEASFNPDDPSPQFSFAGMSPAFTKEDLDDEIRSLARWRSAPEWALKCLQRGIGVHHSGMNKHYRTLVESLYRAGYLRVVIATGTLALGINAPTKTSVFCGDSPFLTALMYRQCAGRAGRRGFDLLGKIVFYGLPMDRCQRLVLSKLPSLGGNFPLTSTMVLRLFNLLQGSNDAPVARNAIKSLLHLPHVSFVSDVGREQILHHIRFSIDYLRRSGLLDERGNPINLFGVAAYLYYTEPSNLALVALLRHGVLHRICNQRSLIRAKRDLMILLSHLFGRRYLPHTYASREFLQTIVKKSPSMVVLPPLSKDARSVLLEHENHIKGIFTGYALAYVSRHAEELGRDLQLPFSKRAICPVSSTAPSAPFTDKLRSTAIASVARSPFVATSGHGDNFRSVKELCDTSRQALYLNEYAIPSMCQFTAIPGEDSKEFALNAYLLDFYIHRQTAALNAANGLRDGEMWYVLQDFSLTLKSIRGGLFQLLQKASDSGSGEDDAVSEVDSGFANMTRAERDPDLDGSEHGSVKPPAGVSDRDWKVYEVLDALTAEFHEKFHKIWA